MAKRIQAKEVVHAFKKSGLTPTTGEYFSANKTCACGLGALYYSHKPEMAMKNESVGISHYFDVLYSKSYRIGFAKGFDGDSRDIWARYDDERYNEGYDDGKDARLLCEKEGLFA